MFVCVHTSGNRVRTGADVLGMSLHDLVKGFVAENPWYDIC